MRFFIILETFIANHFNSPILANHNPQWIATKKNPDHFPRILACVPDSSSLEDNVCIHHTKRKLKISVRCERGLVQPIVFRNFSFVLANHSWWHSFLTNHAPAVTIVDYACNTFEQLHNYFRYLSEKKIDSKNGSRRCRVMRLLSL